MAIKSKVVFLCGENSCRTQMAEAFLRDLAGDLSYIVSAGSEPGRVDPEAIAAMRELGFDIPRHHAKSLTPYLGQCFIFVISLCDRQQERTCPIFPGAIWRQQWELENPAYTEDHRSAVRRVRDQLRERVLRFVSEHQ
jgi:arsenate reductase (thioredoxin)